MKLPFTGTAVVEVEAHVTHRRDMGCIHFSELSNHCDWRAAVTINNRMEWQWCKTKKEAEQWCRNHLPKTATPTP